MAAGVGEEVEGPAQTVLRALDVASIILDFGIGGQFPRYQLPDLVCELVLAFDSLPHFDCCVGFEFSAVWLLMI